MLNTTTRLQTIYRSFAVLFTYPVPDLHTQVRQCQEQLFPDYPEAKKFIDQFQVLINETSLTKLEEIYTSTFDINPVCYPYPGFHLFGENFNRGDFLVKLKQKYQEHGFIAPPHELADHLLVILEFLGTLAPEEILAQELIEDCLLPALDKMNQGIPEHNPYASVIQSLFSFLQSTRPSQELI